MSILAYCNYISQLSFYFLGVFTANIITQSQLSVTAQLGDSVTLQGFISHSPHNNYIWFKQTFGKAPQYVLSSKADSNDSIFYNEFQKSNRFQIQKTKNSFNLSISRLEPSDMGTYYCGVVRRSDVLFGNGTELCLSGKYISPVFQPPVLTPVQYGDSVTVKCIITGVRYRDHHHVYWFWKTKEGTHQSLKTSSENIIQCNNSSEECVYSLQKQNFSSWDVGTYYCALTMCGQIFLGNGGKFTKFIKCYEHYILYITMYIKTEYLTVILVAPSLAVYGQVDF
uniref:Ig-like domain-containing protein n=1 Tax=Erpetoichthys calabaricus TaxID=27687 RepID=A0A8C4XBZ2_ERPCA